LPGPALASRESAASPQGPVDLLTAADAAPPEAWPAHATIRRKIALTSPEA